VTDYEDIIDGRDYQYYQNYFKKKDEEQYKDEEENIVLYWKGN